MLKNYQRLVFVETGGETLPEHESFAQEAAKQLGLTYEKISGTTRLLKALATGPWEDGFVVAPPGRPIKLTDFIDLGEEK